MNGALPDPPYYAVIFASELEPSDDAHYGEVAARMVAMASQQPGFLGVESARGVDGVGITVSYWRDEAAIKAWRENAEHQEARRLGREKFYRWFTLRVARVERQIASRTVD